MKTRTIFSFTLILSTLLYLGSCFAINGSYFDILGGLTFQRKNKVTLNNATQTQLQSTFKPGYDAAASLGYHYGRIYYEYELAYFHNSDDQATYTDAPAGVTPSSAKRGGLEGSQRAVAGLVNFIYRFQNYSAWQPYIGLGVGIAQVRSELGASNMDYYATKVNYAYQGILGMGYVWDSNWTLSVDYRYFGVGPIQYVLRNDQSHGTDTFANHSLNLNFIYYFNNEQ